MGEISQLNPVVVRLVSVSWLKCIPMLVGCSIWARDCSLRAGLNLQVWPRNLSTVLFLSFR